MLVQAVGIPQGYSASIFSDDPKIVLAQTPIDPSSRIGLTIPATNGLDAMITVQVYKGDGAAILPDSSSISLVAHVNSGSGHVVESFVLGAEHIVFDSAIRISRSLVQGRGLGGSSTAQGFYFRGEFHAYAEPDRSLMLFPQTRSGTLMRCRAAARRVTLLVCTKL